VGGGVRQRCPSGGRGDGAFEDYSGEGRDFPRLGDDTIRIETALHGRLIPRHRLVSDQVQITVDLSELNAAIESPPEEEGNLNASVKVTVSEIPK